MPRIDPLDRDFAELQATAEALLRQCPRIELTSFARRMGLPVRSRVDRSSVWLSKQAKAAIAQLEQAGVIQLQAPTPVRESVLVCRPGYQPRQPGSGYVTPCTSRIDPAFQTWQPGDRPTRSPVADIPTAVNWHEKPSTLTETNDMTRTRENEEKALRVVADAEKAAIADGSYKLPSRNELGIRLGLDNYFYAETIGSKNAKKEYFAAQERLEKLKLQASASAQETVLAPLPAPPQPNLYQQKLEEEIRRLQAENQTLKAQIEQVPVNNENVLLQALRDEELRLRTDAAKLLDRIAEMQAIREQLLNNAELIQRLIEQRESAIEKAVATVAATNGHKQLTGVA